MAVERAIDTFVAPGAQVLGDVRMSSESSVWFGAVLRGEAAPVELDEQVNVQDNALVESSPGHPARVGARVSLGHNARVIGATIEARSLVAIGATVLAGAVVGAQSIIAANATVPEGMVIPPRSLVIGHGRILRETTPAEIARIEKGATDYVRLCHEYRATPSSGLAEHRD
jgi:carbonic anhydrase/acetyltransferase-like protein (isoleucine patch superfamily)